MTIIDVTMPQLGESVSEGTISRWLVKEGDSVTKDQPLVEIGTDKADSELPAPSAGRVTKILAQEGTVVAVQAVLCQIDSSAAASTSSANSGSASSAPAPAAASSSASSSSGGQSRSASGVALASPMSRRTALENEVNLDDVRGSGDRGRITKDDVLRARDNVAPANAAPVN
ncbi:MAG: Dihydrolipoamide acyltransferase component of branched-chain alpha-keto acid dehydrogenase complex, partial [Myxococcaceae bacterium]|nr:Dihydrolipoamide acyltransferase component of branched-chain alpha-keto acid dehydrogenase complex [Myxococcaceae bacterium]